ncbi:Os02g0537450 [Oryza sativa Japonica Group]|uniref:Os02g0537450 protein n=1 Tax=Oryza sativa subsp. japonica TaxID=39947 RepID=A0A0P0VK07_ORYSJ|nr:Os02g0537450 [Oryza sativa Japonica Group]
MAMIALRCAPMRRNTDPLPTNSDMSKRINIFSLSNSCSARAFASSVFPTPVEPRKRKEPIGWPGCSRPALERKTACATSLTASSWPTTRSCNLSARWINFSFSS